MREELACYKDVFRSNHTRGGCAAGAIPWERQDEVQHLSYLTDNLQTFKTSFKSETEIYTAI